MLPCQNMGVCQLRVLGSHAALPELWHGVRVGVVQVFGRSP